MTLFIAHGPLTNPIGHPVDPWGKLTVVDTNDNSDLPDALILTCCTVDRIRGRVRRGTEEIKLSTKETALLSYLAARPGQEISREELLHRVWGYAEGVMSRAVDFAIRRLRTKIELNPTDPDHVLTVFGTGYIFVPDVPKRATESPVRALADSPPALATASPLSQLILSETDSFVGRGVDLSALDGLLTKHTRLITLTGPGGIGKTRLARHYAAHRGAEFPGGVCFADLSNSTTADSICAVVGGAMNCAASVHAIGETLRSRERNLLILDNLNACQ